MRASIVISADGGSGDTARRRRRRLDSAALPIQCIAARHDNEPNTDQPCTHTAAAILYSFKLFCTLFFVSEGTTSVFLKTHTNV